MKSPLRKLRAFGYHHKSDSNHKKDHHHHNRQHTRLDELVQATQDMLDMRSCYDSLFSAAAATANSAYEFSEALDEMGTCFLEKTALNEDEDSSRILLMLGKVQFEVQKLVDNYRAHIVQTITAPSESLLKELQTLEEMKNQCDEKRDLYKSMLTTNREKGRSKHAKGESYASLELQEAQEDYEEEANLFAFRLKSLKQGQSRSLLTQAARHHAAQLNFFRKGLKCLETVEPHVKVIAVREHIDYQFAGLEDDYTDEDDDYYSYDGNDDGELSFYYGKNEYYQDTLSSSTNSMEINIHRSAAESLNFNKRPSDGSQSAPIFPDKKFDPPEKIKELRPLSIRNHNTYVLPTPGDAKRSVSVGSVNPVSIATFKWKVEAPVELWHSSPLEPYKFIKNSRDDALSSPTKFPKAHTTVLKERNINNGLIRMPPPLTKELSTSHFNQHGGSDTKRIKSNDSAPDFMPTVEHPGAVSMMPASVCTSQPSISPKASPNISSPPMQSPKVSELHELPRPPSGSARPTRPTSLIGHSEPLVYKDQELNRTSKTSANSSQTALPLPAPPSAVHRSFSIPSRRRASSPVAKFLKDPHNIRLSEDVANASPPLTPISLVNIGPASQASESVTEKT